MAIRSENPEKEKKSEAKQIYIVIFLGDNPTSFKRLIRWLVKYLRTSVKKLQTISDYYYY
jgi:hypothetical protein